MAEAMKKVSRSRKTTTSTAKTTAAPVEEVKSVTVTTAETKTVNAAPHIVKRDKDDQIECRSVTAGELVYIGPKTRIPYDWTNAGDISYLSYEDVLAAVMSRSDYIFKPYFIIEDEELINDPRFREVKQLYDSMYDRDDIDALLHRMSVNQFREEFPKLPAGIKHTVEAEISRGIADGSFDSIGKVHVVDEVCGTNLAMLLA